LKDAGLDAFVAGIERHWGMRAGRERTLSVRDFALARSWFETGISLASVQAGLDRALERDSRVSSLSACERYVAALAPGDRRRRTPGIDEDSDGLVSRLESAREAIDRADAAAAFERAARRLRELLDLIAVAREPNAAFIRGQLMELDELLDVAAVEALPAGEASLLDGEAKRAIERLEGRVDRAAIEEARRRYLRRRARERFALARLVVD